jgi:hypothetical protein
MHHTSLWSWGPSVVPGRGPDCMVVMILRGAAGSLGGGPLRHCASAPVGAVAAGHRRRSRPDPRSA